MSIYVMSDIHGQLATFHEMLEKIEFSDADTLYILGDAIDRGPDGINILLDIIDRENVEFVLGNHELLLLDAITNLRDIQEKDRHDTDDLDLWQDPCNGGKITYEKFRELDWFDQHRIEAYLKNSWVIRKIKVGRKNFYLSHSYALPQNIGMGVHYKELTHHEVWQVVWQNIFDAQFVQDHLRAMFPNKKNVYISGHTFTQRLDCVDENGCGKVYYNKDYYGYCVYNIDCGMALKNKTSRLACMRLGDEEIFYVPLYK